MALHRPHRSSQTPPRAASLKPLNGGYLLEADLADGRVLALLPTDDSATLAAEGLETTGAILVRRYGSDGSIVETVSLGE